MNVAKIQDLKRRLAECTDFAVFWNFYFDNFAENREFINNGRLMTGERQRQILAEIALRVFGETSLALVNPMLIEHLESGAIHGTCMVKSKLMCILFFPDLDLGMAAFSEIYGKSRTDYCRFSITTARAIAAAN